MKPFATARFWKLENMGLGFQGRRIKAQLAAVVHHKRRSYYYSNPTGKL